MNKSISKNSRKSANYGGNVENVSQTKLLVKRTVIRQMRLKNL